MYQKVPSVLWGQEPLVISGLLPSVIPSCNPKPALKVVAPRLATPVERGTWFFPSSARGFVWVPCSPPSQWLCVVAGYCRWPAWVICPHGRAWGKLWYQMGGGTILGGENGPLLHPCVELNAQLGCHPLNNKLIWQMPGAILSYPIPRPPSEGAQPFFK